MASRLAMGAENDNENLLTKIVDSRLARMMMREGLTKKMLC